MSHTLEKFKYEEIKLAQENELKIAAYAFESNEPMLITDISANIIKANQAFCNVMGYKKEQLMQSS